MRALHVDFPLVAVSLTAQSLGVICLDHRLQLREARSRSLARFPRQHAKNAFADTSVRALVDRMGAAAIALEERSSSTNAAAMTKALERALGGIPVGQVTFRDACTRIVGVPSAALAAKVLADRYDVLARELVVGPRGPFGTAERYSRVRPLLGAIAIGHAVALDALIRRG